MPIRVLSWDGMVGGGDWRGEEEQIPDIVLSGNCCVTLGRSPALSEPLSPIFTRKHPLYHLSILLKGRFWFSGFGWGPRFCTSDVLQGDARAAGSQTSLGDKA